MPEPPRPDLVDLRPLQRRSGDDEPAALQMGAGPLLGLADPDLPRLDEPVLANFDRVFPNAYAAALAGPGALRRLTDGDDDPLFVARLLLDQSVAKDAPPCLAPEGGLQGALARYWRTQTGFGPVGEALAVLTRSPETPLCRELQRRGAALFAATPFPLLSPRTRRVLVVIGNTKPDAELIYLLHRYGGDVLLTDSCLLAAYDDAQASRLAAAELGRPVPPSEMRQWRQGIARPQALLLGEVAAAARRLFVLSPMLAEEIGARYRREATVLPLPTAGPRILAHAAGLWAECCVWAAEMLAAWGVDLRLDLVAPVAERPALEALAAQVGVGGRLSFSPGLPSLALFLSMRGQDATPELAIEAAAAGLPIVASRSVRDALHLPRAAILPDQPSPPLLAEAIMAALGTPMPAGIAAAADHLLAALEA